jgi:uncharacterized repeat protein (TIGR01451 family)
VFKSTDAGGKWTPINSGLPSTQVELVVTDPIRPNLLYAGTSGYGVYKSVDGGASWYAAGMVTSPGAESRRVVIIDIDGLRKSAFDQALRDGRLPNFEKILGGKNCEKALCFDAATTVFPSVTLAAQASLFTGLYPGRHGIAGNQWFNRTENQEVNYFSMSNAQAVYGVDYPGGLANGHLAHNNVATLYDAASAAGLSSFVIFNQYWKGTPAGGAIQPSSDELYLYGLTSTGIEPDVNNYRVYDVLMVSHALTLVRVKGLPRILTLYFTGLDATGHKLGAEGGSQDVVQIDYLSGLVDTFLSPLLEEFERQDRNWRDNILFVITSDHGQTQVSRSENVGSIIESALEEIDHHDYKLADNGGMVHVYLRNREFFPPHSWQDLPRYQEDVLAAAKLLSASSALHELVWKILVRGPQGRYAVYISNGVTQPVGEDSELMFKEELIHGLNSFRSGDVLLLLKPEVYSVSDLADRVSEFLYFGNRGNHGSLHDSDLMVPLVFAGGGIRTGHSSTPVSTVNVAKTVARYLGFEGLMKDAQPAAACLDPGTFNGEYFANPSLAGAPALTRCDDKVDFAWGDGSPDPRLPPHGFSARWTRTLNLEGGRWRFTASADGRVRLFVDDALVLDPWRDGSATSDSVDLDLPSGSHTIRMEYYHTLTAAVARLSWERSGPAAALVELKIVPSAVTGGVGATGAVTLNAPAPWGGALVGLKTSSPAAQVPASVTVLAGQISASFQVATSNVTSTQTLTVTATYAGASKTATLTLNPGGSGTSMVKLDVTVNRRVVTSGGNVKYSIAVSNRGPAPIDGARLRDPLPEGMTNASCGVPSGACSYADGIVTAALPVLAPSATVKVSIWAKAPYVTAVTALNNTAILALPGPVPVEIQASQTVTINPWAPQSGGPGGGEVVSLIVDPRNSDTVYVGGWGVLKSTDGAQTWLASQAGLPESFFSLLMDPVRPSILYALGPELFKSPDGGRNWYYLRAGIFSLAVDPDNPDTLFAGTQTGVLVSRDGGLSWSASGTGIRNGSVNTIAISPSEPHIIYAALEAQAFYTSSDGGRSWAAVSPSAGLPSYYISALQFDPTNPRTVYAVTQGGVVLSSDRGATWTPFPCGAAPSTPFCVLSFHPTRPGTIYAQDENRTYRTSDGGRTWALDGAMTALGGGQLAFGVTDPAVMYLGGSQRGVSRSRDGGLTWTPANRGLGMQIVNALAVVPSQGAIFAGTRGGLFKSTDGGPSWTLLPLGSPPLRVAALAVSPKDPSVMYAAAEGFLADSVWRSTDGGRSWAAAGTGLADKMIHCLAIDPAQPSTVYAGTSRGLLAGHQIFKTTDGGRNWFALITAPLGAGVSSIAIDPSDSRTLYASSAGILKSVDGGLTWFTATREGINQVVIDPGNPARIYAIDASATGLIVSNDRGHTWNATGSGPAGDLFARLVIDPLNTSNLYASSWDDGLFKTTDGGKTLSPVNSGLPARYIMSLAVDTVNPSTVYAGTMGAGVFKTTDGGTTWVPTGTRDLP